MITQTKSQLQSEFLHFGNGAEGGSIVNVASVPQRSPFRYPGGKTWLVPRVREWLSSFPRPKLFIEPFAGGGIISLTVAFEDLAEKVLMVELDKSVAAVWESILNPSDAKWLAHKILTYELTREGCEKDLKQAPKNTREQAFLTILRNRVCRGGILAKGAGFIEYGEKGKGVHSRWYPKTLKTRIDNVSLVRDRITFLQADAFDIIKKFSSRSDVVWFIDPPYTASKKKAGARLYTHFEIDHRRLFQLISDCAGDCLMTYDNAEEIKLLADEFGYSTKQIAMKNNHHAEMKELIIGKNLSWA